MCCSSAFSGVSGRSLRFFPKRFLSWGFKTLFASASSCQCKPPHFSSPAGLCRVNLDQPRSSGAHKILTELLCPARARNSIAATRPRFDFIYTEMVARRRFEFYLHRDGCAAAIRVLSTQRFGLSKSCGGRCVKKWRFSKSETAFAGVQNFFELSSCHHVIMSSRFGISKSCGGRCVKKWRF